MEIRICPTKEGGGMSFHTFKAALISALLAVAASTGHAAPAKITLKNGLSQIGDIASADRNGVMWRGRNTGAARLVNHNQIAKIDFRAPKEWEEANTHFYKRDYAKAIALYSAIASNPGAHYFPAPGNFASLAMLRLVDCYSETGNSQDLTKVVAMIDPNSLALSDQGDLGTISCWAALGKGDWESALAMLEKVGDDPMIPGAADRAFIRGVALEKTGKPEDAIVAYAGAYSLEFGGQNGMSRRALQNSVKLLQSLKDETRREELRALVHSYAHIFNDGKLWENPNPVDQDLFAENLELTKAEFRDGESPDSPIIAIRFRQKTLLQRGKSKPFSFIPDLPSPGEDQAKKENVIPSVSIAKLSSTEVTLKIEANTGSGITYQRSNGLGVFKESQSAEDQSINEPGESLSFSVTGVKAFRIVSITFGGGGPNFELENDDSVTLEVTGVADGQSAYPPEISGAIKADKNEEKAASTAFRRMPVSGGFIKSDGGSFTIVRHKGAFGIDAIAIELKSELATTTSVMPTPDLSASGEGGDLYTQTGEDVALEEVLKTGIEMGIAGSTIDVNNQIVEVGPNAGRAIPSDIRLQTTSNIFVPREDFPKWSRWYQEDGNTQVFRLFEGEEAINESSKMAVRMETFSELKWQKGESHEWAGTFTVIKPHDGALLQVNNNAHAWSFQITMDDNGNIILNHREGGKETLAENMVGKPFHIRGVDDGHDYQVFLNDEEVGSGSYERPTGHTSFKWGIFTGAKPQRHDTMVFVTGATIDP